VNISNKITLEETIKVIFTRVLNFFLEFKAYTEQANVPNNNIKDIMPNIPCSIELYGLPKRSENKKKLMKDSLIKVALDINAH